MIFASAGLINIYHAERGELTVVNPGLKLDRNIPAGRIALQGARIVTLADRQVIENGTVIVEGSRLACVGACDVSSADQVLDVQGKTIIPGFVDVHAHGY